MKTMMLILAFMTGVPLTLFAEVSKEDLKKLVAAGISDGVILSYVKANGPVAKLSPTDVIELKQAGVTESLLAAVLSVTGPAVESTSGNVSPSYAYAPAPSYGSSAVYEDVYPAYYNVGWGYYSPSFDLGVGCWSGPYWGGYYGGRYCTGNFGNRFWNGFSGGRVWGGHSGFGGFHGGGFSGAHGGFGGAGHGGFGGGGHGGGGGHR